VFDRFDFRITLQNDGIETALLTRYNKRWFEFTQALGCGIRPHVFIMVQHHPANVIPDGHNRTAKPALLPRVRRPLLALGRIRVQVDARDPIFACNQVSADALGGGLLPLITLRASPWQAGVY